MSENKTNKCSNCGSEFVPSKDITLDGELPLDGSWAILPNENLVCPKCHPNLVKEGN